VAWERCDECWRRAEAAEAVAAGWLVDDDPDTDDCRWVVCPVCRRKAGGDGTMP